MVGYRYDDFLYHLQRREKTQNAAVNHKFGSPVAKHKPRFIPKNKTIFLVGSYNANTAPSTVAPPPLPPLATDREKMMPIAKGLRQQKRRIGALIYRQPMDQRVDLLSPKTQLLYVNHSMVFYQQ